MSEWDGAERRKRPRKRWQIGVPRQISIGEIIAAVTIVASVIASFKELEGNQRRQDARIDEVICEIRYLRAKADGVTPQPCPSISPGK